MTTKIALQEFFPPDMMITSINETANKIVIRIKSRTKNQKCPMCGEPSNYHQVTYNRTITELPLIGKPIELIVTAYKYKCFNQDCAKKIFCEELHGFTGKHRRRSSRCEDLIAAIGLNTNGETGALICKYMGINVSGDTIIRILMKKAEEQPKEMCSEVIGVDDWAYKKRHTYGTIICDGETHRPITLLEGRDGSELKKWLNDNKHVKVVTRDRAGAYAAAISEILPEAIQVADRFHLYANLLKAVKDAINSQIPEKIDITEQFEDINNEIIDDENSDCIIEEESKKKPH